MANWAKCVCVGEAGTTDVRGKGCEADILPLYSGCPPHGPESIYSAETTLQGYLVSVPGATPAQGELKAKLAVGHP